MTKKLSFLVDRFNVYHSLRTLHGMSGAAVRWLDLRALCNSYLQAVHSGIGERVELAEVHYFSALAEHLIARNADVVARHKVYIRALEQSGVQVQFSQFKRKAFQPEERMDPQRCASLLSLLSLSAPLRLRVRPAVQALRTGARRAERATAAGRRA